MNLNGEWKLYYYPVGSKNINTPIELKNAKIDCVPATVPGNVELDLSRAGVLPEDLYKGNNILKAEKYETYEWWYEKSFTPSELPSDKKAILHFGAVDCYADYFLNDEKIGSSDNMFISYDFDVTDKLEYGKENTVYVKIYSTVAKIMEYDSDPNLWGFNQNISPLVRKAPHCFGWDIMPRAVSAGIWRDVELRYEDIYSIKYFIMDLKHLKGDTGAIKVNYDTYLKPEYSFEKLKIEIEAKCGEHTFKHTSYRKGKSGGYYFDVPNLKLWWPYGYGEANLYDINVKIYSSDDELLLTKSFTQGFRTLKLVRSDTVCDGGSFHFEINGVKIMAVGTNWVPMDAYHSRDAKRYEKALELVKEANCNIVRCWGGNVYEDHAFFDYCDKNGIMVWQDFAMACANYPQTEEFFARITKEAEWVIKELRGHTSLVLWCGDNEVDSMRAAHGDDPQDNRITREILPNILKRLDLSRPYIPSSPYISPAAFKEGPHIYPEEHLWGPRDYYKNPYYTESNAYFVSETGYHGCPNRESIEKFIDEEKVWPYHDNDEWNLHSSDQNNSSYRTMLMENQVRVLFGEVPTDMDEYIRASQISQAEAKKFFIERIRIDMKRNGGIIWWNLIDGWPQMSDAVVDYYYNKKLAFEYIKCSSLPMTILCDEMTPWDYDVVTANNTLNKVNGKVKVYDVTCDKLLVDTDFVAEPNSNTNIAGICTMYCEKGMLVMTWETEEGKFYNTYLYGNPTYSLKEYEQWLKKAKAFAKEQ